ncbi:MAG: hypothetical protein HKN06_04510 [Gammaproteobacteria bacterium]|nr:hypothetical protein [Gammaproteobacteria bacterium]
MAESEELVCWNCGESLAELTLPLRRLEVCRACNAELHVCKLCEFYDTGVAKSCREPVAEEVRDKEQANFCDYFRPAANAYVELSTGQAEAESQLKTLFGDENAEQETDPQSELESLFRKKTD